MNIVRLNEVAAESTGLRGILLNFQRQIVNNVVNGVCFPGIKMSECETVLL